MHLLHEYISKQIAGKLKSSRVLVWYDPRSEFVPFIDELRGKERLPGVASELVINGLKTHLAEYSGSLFELRTIVEPFVSDDEPSQVFIFVPGIERDRSGSVLMELERAGSCEEPDLKRIARNVLEKKYSVTRLDEILNRPSVTYQDLVNALADTGPEASSVLRAIFPALRETEPLLAEWLANESKDSELASKQATPELLELIHSQIGLKLAPNEPLAKCRAITIRYILGNDFRSDLRGSVPGSLDSIPIPATNKFLSAVRNIAVILRMVYPKQYECIADRLESELKLDQAGILPTDLGPIDTFRFEDRLLLRHCGELIADAKYEKATSRIKEREKSIWLERNVARKMQWEACQRMAELGQQALAVRSAISKTADNPSAWVEAYCGKEGWHRLDHTQRMLETWVSSMEEDPEDRPLAIVRRAYEETCHSMAEKFSKTLVKAEWSIPGTLHQTRIFSEVVSDKPKPVAYFCVDALRFEMGAELVERLQKSVESAEVNIRPAIAALPSITPVGMAALLPGASGNFSVVEQNKKLGSRVGDTFLPDLTSRRKHAIARVPNLVDLTLDELLGLQSSKLRKKLEGAHVIIVRSQEIDLAGETGFPFQARQVMSTVIDNLVRAIRKLALAGTEHSVISADHGHLFFSQDRDESMRIESPGGDQVDLHRRCWIGRGGSTPPGCIRVSASDLGYESDLEFVFPSGSGVFRAGGDLAFHHGGTSLQELVVPVVSVRFKNREQARPTTESITMRDFPGTITNRIFTATLELGGKELSLFSVPTPVRPVLMASGKQVGAVGMVIGADFDKSTGSVMVQQGKTITVAFMLSDESVPSVRIVVQDPATEAELYRSPVDIPVKLGV